MKGKPARPNFAALQKKAIRSHAEIAQKAEQDKALTSSRYTKMTQDEKISAHKFSTRRKLVRTAKGHAISRGGLKFNDINELRLDEQVTRSLAQVDYTLKDRQINTAGRLLQGNVMGPLLRVTANSSELNGKMDQYLMKALSACNRRLERIIRLAEKTNQLGQLVELLPIFKDFQKQYYAEQKKRKIK